LIRPLTRRTAKGELLRRRPEVEDQIKGILNLEEQQILKRAEVCDSNCPEYLKPECLVYLIRTHRSEETSNLAGQVTKALTSRCIKTLPNRIKGFSNLDTQDITDDIVAELIKQMFDPSDKADYLEVSFEQTLKCIRIDVCRKYRAMRSGQAALDESKDASDERLDMTMAMLIKSALASLTDGELQIVLLRHFCGLSINGKGQQPTIVAITRLSERTIRNRLWSAKQKLKKAIRGSEGQTNAS
jgi:DNA-directed RNA polymerase specialized sigma24 family protein